MPFWILAATSISADMRSLSCCVFRDSETDLPSARLMALDASTSSATSGRGRFPSSLTSRAPSAVASAPSSSKRSANSRELAASSSMGRASLVSMIRSMTQARANTARVVADMATYVLATSDANDSASVLRNAWGRKAAATHAVLASPAPRSAPKAAFCARFCSLPCERRRIASAIRRMGMPTYTMARKLLSACTMWMLSAFMTSFSKGEIIAATSTESRSAADMRNAMREEDPRLGAGRGLRPRFRAIQRMRGTAL